MENKRRNLLKICHIADIHIRSTQRHNEYRRVFQNLRADIKSRNVDYVWIGGDIFHTKLSGISPEYISLLHDVLRSLSDVAEVHMMLGNHDGNIANLERMDAVSPIVEIMNNPRVKLYKTSGVYPITPDSNWCVYSPFDSEKWTVVQPEKDKYNIACFHGPVNGAKTSTEWELEGDKNAADFEKFDIALLGDIHKMQFLGTDKRIAYPGSLIQQDYGEDLDHGYLLWTIDLDSRKHDVEFVKIEGANPFITLSINEKNYEKIIRNDLDELKNVRCRVICEDLSEVQKTALKETLSSNNVSEVVIIDSDASDKNVKKKISESIKMDSMDSLLRQTKTYIEENIKTTIQWESIEKTIRNYADKLKIGNVKPHRWTINKLSFDNLYSYSESNHVDFSSFSGLIGITGANASGKSSVLGSLLYALFNSSDRDCTKNAFYINDSKDNASAKCEIDVDGCSYEILRTSVRSTKDRDSSSTKLGLKSLSKKMDLTGEQRNDTDKVIRELIGSVDDFMMTSMAVQEDMGKFLREGSSSRKEIVSRFLGIDCLMDIHILAKKDLNNIKAERKALGVSSTVLLLDLLNKKEIDLAHKLDDQRNKTIIRDNLSKEIQNIEIEIIQNGSSLLNKNELESELFKFQNLKQTIQNQLSSLNIEISRSETEILELDKKIAVIDALEILQKMDEAIKMKENLGILKGNLSLANEKLQSAKKSSLKLLEVPCEGSFPTCKFILDSHRDKEALDSLQKNVSELEPKVKQLNEKLEVLKIDDLVAKNKNKEEFSKLKEKIIREFHSKQSNISSRNESLTKIDEKIISLQNQLRSANDTRLDELKSKKLELVDLQSELNESYSDLGSLKKEIEITKKQIEACSNLDKKQDLLEVIVNSFSKDGLPKYVMSQHTDYINDRMNDLLSKVVDFTVNFSIDDEKGNLDIFLNKRGRKRIAELGSGMERTLISLALRVALREISCIPMPDFFIVDEGFSMLDADNVMACRNLLNELKKMFRFVIVMTHNDTIKEMMDKTLEVSMVGDFSKID